MGQGIAVKPSQGVVYAPADAEVSIAFPTGHAFGLKTTDGAEVLIHVGIDTVSMMVTVLKQKLLKVIRLKLAMFLEHLTQTKSLQLDLMIQQWLSLQIQLTTLQ